MLDVHAPHESIHTVKDFLIHIAAIVVGLLLAVGLEQTVEHIHLKYQLRDARVALEQERKSNVDSLAAAAQEWRWEMVELQNNLLVLRFVQQHPGAPQTSLPGDLRWEQDPVRFNHAVWDAAQQNGIVRLMPLQESNADQQRYLSLQVLADQGLAEWNAFNDGRRFEFVDPDPTHLSPQQLAEQINLTAVAIEKHLQVGYSIAFIGSNFPDLPTHLSFDQVDSYLVRSPQSDSPAMVAVRRLTTGRLAAAGLNLPGDSPPPAK